MKQELTLLIPCKNEQLNIRPCIESGKGIADEVLVADSGSTDKTMDIARELGARVIERDYVNSADFKNWALPQVKTPWVLIVDSDERVTSKLAEEIRKLLGSEPPLEGYWIYRTNFFMGHRIKSCGWNRDKVLRLFKTDYRYEPKHVHAEVMIDKKKAGKLRNRLDHFSYWSIDQYFEKFGRYTKWGAQDAQRKGKRPGFLNLTIRPAWRFFKHYILERGFLEGKRGLIVSGLGAFSVFTKYARLWTMEKGLPQPDPEKEAAESGDKKR